MTDTHNPYAPPAVAVADIFPVDDAAFQPVKIFGAKGRIGRMRYVAYMIGAGFFMNIAMWVLMMVVGLVTLLATLGSDGPSAARPSNALSMTVGIATVVIWGVISVLWLIFYVRATMQRGHDLNLSGWTVLLTFIPFVNLYWVFAPGSQGANRYGAPPPPNSTGVQVVFWIGVGLFALMLFVMILGIGAAILIPMMQK